MVIEPALINQALKQGVEVVARIPKPTYNRIIERLISIDNEFTTEVITERYSHFSGSNNPYKYYGKWNKGNKS
jgi:hypothetical protein